ncbi:MAG: hypothetical protein U9Q29_08435 [Campylobacterota bacterium]|nr:hypothetical protein [Campylobacterota bacterium]
MYYVIKKEVNNPLKCFIGFKVPKYIASKNSDNVIFEFNKDAKTQRKWIAKEDIVLLTDDKEFFIKTMNQFTKIEQTQQKLVDTAEDNLSQAIQTLTKEVNNELNKFIENKNSDEIPSILKDL